MVWEHWNIELFRPLSTVLSSPKVLILSQTRPLKVFTLHRGCVSDWRVRFSCASSGCLQFSSSLWTRTVGRSLYNTAGFLCPSVLWTWPLTQKVGSGCWWTQVKQCYKSTRTDEAPGRYKDPDTHLDSDVIFVCFFHTPVSLCIHSNQSPLCPMPYNDVYISIRHFDSDSCRPFTWHPGYLIQILIQKESLYAFHGWRGDWRRRRINWLDL